MNPLRRLSRRLSDGVARVYTASSNFERAQETGRWAILVHRLQRIVRLLMLGYATAEEMTKYERDSEWERLHAVFMYKIDNIIIVSGLLLGSSCNLLIVDGLRRMTYTTIAASMYGSIFSVFFGLLCRINMTPARMQFLVRRSWLFYYLCSTPSLYGGGAALAFFAAICGYTWLEESTSQYGWEAKASALVMSILLIINALVCFVLGVANLTRFLPGDEEFNASPQSPPETPGMVVDITDVKVP